MMWKATNIHKIKIAAERAKRDTEKTAVEEAHIDENIPGIEN